MKTTTRILEAASKIRFAAVANYVKSKSGQIWIYFIGST